MEQNIGIALCVCTCLLCVIEVILFGYSIYKRDIAGIIIHILGIVVSALFSIMLIAYIQNIVLSFETNNVILGVIIAGFVFAIAVSIKSLFRDSELTQNERIKEKRKKLKEINDSKANDNDNISIDEKEDLSLNKKKNSTLSNDNNKKTKDAIKEETTKKDNKNNEYNNSYDDENKMTMVKRSQKRKNNKKKNSKKKHK